MKHLTNKELEEEYFYKMQRFWKGYSVKGKDYLPKYDTGKVKK